MVLLGVIPCRNGPKGTSNSHGSTTHPRIWHLNMIHVHRFGSNRTNQGGVETGVEVWLLRTMGIGFGVAQEGFKLWTIIWQANKSGYPYCGWTKSHVAPPTKPWNDDSPVHINKQWLQPWFQSGAKWILCIHSSWL